MIKNTTNDSTASMTSTIRKRLRMNLPIKHLSRGRSIHCDAVATNPDAGWEDNLPPSVCQAKATSRAWRVGLVGAGRQRLEVPLVGALRVHAVVLEGVDLPLGHVPQSARDDGDRRGGRD